MISVRVGGSPDLARQGRTRHKLFVEGSSRDNIDYEFLKILLPMIDIEVMGPSFYLKSVATALHPHHQDYYFLIDRDHHDEQTVNDSWRNFPDPETSNLLILRKKEIENYFLDPDYLQKSEWIKRSFIGESGRQKLEKKILRLANARLFMEVVNRVILTIREGQKRTWIETFSNPRQFTSTQVSKDILLCAPEFLARSEEVAGSVCIEHAGRLFDITLEEMTGGELPLVFNGGSWLARMSGKEILRQVVNTCFQVKDSQDRIIQGEAQYLEVIKDLARLDLPHQPHDFQELYELVDSRTKTP